jgi:hypothetical protein
LDEGSPDRNEVSDGEESDIAPHVRDDEVIACDDNVPVFRGERRRR